MRESYLAPASREDELADEAVARGRNAGGLWIAASALALGSGLIARTVARFAVAWAAGLVLLTIGLTVRTRYWRAVTRRLGDATIQRARWRTVGTGRERVERIVAALVIVLLLVGLEVWTN